MTLGARENFEESGSPLRCEVRNSANQTNVTKTALRRTVVPISRRLHGLLLLTNLFASYNLRCLPFISLIHSLMIYVFF